MNTMNDYLVTSLSLVVKFLSLVATSYTLVRWPAPSYSMAIIAVRAHARRHCAIKKQLAEQHLLESAMYIPLGLLKFVEKVTEAWRPREARKFS